ncbi:MAG: MFS transporter [Candidatus Hydrogenedentes bacterium]|nr:MFS transporter [Candidatus Hydrogenedentota bacterium]
MERNLRLYPAYATAFAAHFWLPVFFLYFQSHLTVAQVLRLEALYYFAVVLTEVPSGYFSDVIGRRITLILAAASVCVAHGLFFFGSSFSHFAAGQIFLAIGMAFNSGTNTALHYDTLARLDRTKEYDQREARVARLAFLGSGVAALLGGVVATFGLRNAYALSFAGGLAALALATAMKEPNRHTDGQRLSVFAFRLEIGQALRELRQPALRWLSAYVVIMIVLNHLPYIFYQPYLDQLLQGPTIVDGATPLSSGTVTFITMIVAAYIAGRSIWLRDRLGLVPTLLLGTALQTLIIAAMALIIHPLIVFLILLRSCPRAIMTAPRNAAINPLIQEEHRATYLSLESLVGRLAFSAVLWGLATLGGPDSDLRAILLTATAIAVVGLIGLLISARAFKKQ